MKLKGYDGNWIEKEKLLSKNIDFMAADLAKTSPQLKEKYDLCISVETAEHLPKSRSADFVKTLCAASDIVIFSAASPFQGDEENHVNEQWPSYWVKLFHDNGYECLDIFRPALWNNKEVVWWYRQNTFLFVNRTSNLAENRDLRNMAVPITDVIHPDNWLWHQTPELKSFFIFTKSYLLRKGALFIDKLINRKK